MCLPAFFVFPALENLSQASIQKAILIPYGRTIVFYCENNKAASLPIYNIQFVFRSKDRDCQQLHVFNCSGQMKQVGWHDAA